MIANTRTQPNSSPSFSDEAIRRFLLGQLNSTEQSVFEERLITSDELAARVRLAELRLADDYAYERLSRADRERVRRIFLLSADRDQTLGVSKALRDRFAPISEPKITAIQRFMTWFDISQPAWRYAFAALILLLVFATVWRATKQPRLVQQNTPRRLAPKPTATQTPREAQHSVTSSSPIHVEQSPAMPAHDVIALTVVLDSKSTRDNPTKVNLPKDELSVVRFQILLEKNQPGPYRAEVLSANGESRFSADSLEPADGTKLSFDVSAGLLKSGDYQVKLTRIGGLSENVGSYYFRVQ